MKKLARKKLKKKKNDRSKLNNGIRKTLTIFLILILVFILTAVIIGGSILINYQKEARQTVDKCTSEDFKSQQTSLMYDKNGTLITAMKSEKDVYYLSSQNIPYLVKRAFVATEDRNFYKHSGVDYSAVLRAAVEFVKNLGEITQGGSTITQQLSRNIFLSQEVTLDRKLNEMFIAMELEKKFSKEEILEFYINNIYFANGFYGIEAAARGYFSKGASQLSLSEVAFLCSIPNNPNEYDPYQYFDNTVERRDRILKQMLDQGCIDQDLYEEAINEEIQLNPSINGKNNYVETYTRYCAAIALMKAGGFKIRTTFSSDSDKEGYLEDYQEAYEFYAKKLYIGGYRIYTSIDLNVQNELQNTLDGQLSPYSEVNEEGIYKLQGSAVCIDNATGLVTAIVGGRSQDYAGYTLNRAYQSFRQPGSSIKPILTYTPLFERGYTPDSMVRDEPMKDGPVNSPNVYEGDITLRYAVVKSKNTVAWQLFQELTPATAISYLLNMNFSKIDSLDYVPAMSLGGMTYGASTLEMASAYGTLENDGVYRMPTCIVKITDSSGQVVVSNSTEETQIYKQNAARMMTDVLKDVLAVGTGRNFQVGNAVCAAKTGTTNDNKDIWLVGYSAYYTTAVWTGYDMPREIKDAYITSSSGAIWKNFMTTLHNGLEIKELKK